MSFRIMGCNLENYKKPLAECARTDDKGEKSQFVLKHGENEVVNLDGMSQLLKKMYANSTLSSCDAFYEASDYYFIEFKNQPFNNIDTEDIQKKALISPIVVQMVYKPKETFEQISGKSILFIVYKDDPTITFENIQDKMFAWTKLESEPLKFNLRYHKNNGLYKEIHTIPVSTFNELYSDKIFGQ